MDRLGHSCPVFQLAQWQGDVDADADEYYFQPDIVVVRVIYHPGIKIKHFFNENIAELTSLHSALINCIVGIA